jgi:hypothetical protein
MYIKINILSEGLFFIIKLTKNDLMCEIYDFDIFY